MRRLLIIQGKPQDKDQIPPMLGRIFINSFNRVYNMDGMAAGMFKNEDINSQWNQMALQKLTMNPYVEVYKSSQLAQANMDDVVGSGHTDGQMNSDEVKKSIHALEKTGESSDRVEVLRRLLLMLQDRDDTDASINRDFGEDTPQGALKRFRRRWYHLLNLDFDTAKKDITFDEASQYMEDRRALLENSFGLDEEQMPPPIKIVANIVGEE